MDETVSKAISPRRPGGTLRRLRRAAAGLLVAVAIGLVLLAGWQPRAPVEPMEPWQGGRLVVASYNLLWGNHDWRNIADVIRKADAHVVVLQESSPAAEKNLTPLLRSRYPYMEFRNPTTWSGLAILSRFPLTNIRTVLREGGNYYRGMLADIEVDGRTVSIANVHLHHKKALRRTEHIRVRAIHEIYGLLPAGGIHVIAGDFNSYSNEKAPSYLKGKGMIDSFASVAGRGDARGTWHWKKGIFTVTTRIDYIFHGPELRTTHSRVIEEGKSDHYPLVSAMVWSNGHARATPTTGPTTRNHGQR